MYLGHAQLAKYVPGVFALHVVCAGSHAMLEPENTWMYYVGKMDGINNDSCLSVYTHLSLREKIA